MRGNVAPESEKPAPVSVAALTVTAAVPVEERVRDCEDVEFTETAPKLRLEELMLSVGTEAPSCKAKDWDALPKLAVSVADCAEETAETAAVKLAPIAPAAIVTAEGTTTEELLLSRAIASPPLAAAAFRVTVQASLPAPVIVEFAQERAASTGTPAPERLRVIELPEDELLARVSVPLAAPAVVGSN